MSDLLGDLATRPTPAILDSLRGLERKTSLVSMLMKASVYSMMLAQQMDQDGDSIGFGASGGTGGDGTDGE
jgi:DASH complex subunit DAD3